MSRAADSAARRAACTEFARPFVLVAGAGTGKTTALVARVVTWLVGPGYAAARADAADDAIAVARAVDGVLAITFTKAAAAEMDQRVRKVLRRLEAGEPATGVLLGGEERAPDPDEQALARRLRLALDRPIATTIHGFCQALLAEHPLEAGLPPGFTVDGEAQVLPEIARDAVEADLAAAFAEGQDPAWVALARAGIGPDAVAACVARLRAEGVRARDLELDPLDPATLEAFLDGVARPLRDLAGTAFAQLVGLKGAKAVQRVAEVVLALDDVLRGRDPRAPAAAIDAARDLGLDEAAKKLAVWGAGDWGVKAAALLDADLARATALSGELAPRLRALAGLDPAGLAARRAVVLRTLARAEREGDQQGVLSYGDLLVRAAELVRARPDVVRRLRARTRQVLVDEFQDTDDVQCALVEALALAGDGPKPGLFLVGDPKQSIYGWRSADLAAYDAFVAQVRRAGGAGGELTRNFRSTRTVLDAVERLVRPVMHAELGVQPPFQPLEPDLDVAGPAVELWCAWETAADAPKRLEDTPARRAAELEAHALARALRAERELGTPWKSMAVLVRAKTGLDAALEALREASIPFQVEGDRSYYRRREVLDACALLGAIADPGDDLSLVAFLRSAACGVPDAALEPLWRELPGLASGLGGADDAALLERARALAFATERELSAGPAPGGRAIPGFAHALVHALESVAALRRALHTEPPDVFLERLRALLLLEPAEAARHQGRYRAANLARFFRHLAEELDVAGDAQALLRALRRALAEQREERDARPAGQAEEAVRILTIHASKGLEFDAVFLLGAQRRPRRSGAAPDAFDRASGEHRLLGLETPGWWEVEERVRRREAAEQVRLLYVATTRAKRRLVVSGVWRETFERREVARAATLADLLEHGAPPTLDVELQRALAESRAAFELDGFGVQLLRDDAPLAAGAPASPDLSGLVEAAERDDRRLESLRRAAAERAARPRLAAASAVADAARAEPEPARGAARGARLVGTLVHAALEELPLRPEPDWPAGRAALERTAGELDAPPEARAAALALYDEVARGPLGARLAAAAPHVVARELALAAPARPEDLALDALHGAADLVYRDGEAWVVADYKSDAPEPSLAPAGQAARHAPQLDAYARALQDALGLPAPPRREVWLLRAGLVVELA